MKRKTRKQLELEYDALYEKIDKLISETNPCEVTIKNKVAYCGSCSFRVCGDIIKPNELCCDKCPHHNMTTGCQADKPMNCKLWLCHQSKRKHPEVARQLFFLHEEANNLFGCLLHRGDKKETIDHIINMNMEALWVNA